VHNNAFKSHSKSNFCPFTLRQPPDYAHTTIQLVRGYPKTPCGIGSIAASFLQMYQSAKPNLLFREASRNQSLINNRSNFIASNSSQLNIDDVRWGDQV